MSACVLYHKPSRWDEELTRPIDWGVEEYEHLKLGDRVFLSRTGLDGGIFAAGTVVAPPPDRNIIHPPVVFESPNPEGDKMTPHINVLVDIPPPPANPANPPKCSHDYPVLHPKLPKRIFGRSERLPNGIEVPLSVSVERLCDDLRREANMR